MEITWIGLIWIAVIATVIYKAGGKGKAAVAGFYRGRVEAWKGSSPEPAPAGVKVGAAIATGAVGGFLYLRGFAKGMKEGWPTGSATARKWYEQRTKKEAGTDEPGLCPQADCRANLAKMGWPAQHQNRKRELCQYDWKTDSRWQRCPDCKTILLPGDKCVDCNTTADRKAKPVPTAAPETKPAAPAEQQDDTCQRFPLPWPSTQQCTNPKAPGEPYCQTCIDTIEKQQTLTEELKKVARDEPHRLCRYNTGRSNCTDLRDEQLGNGYCTRHDALVAAENARTSQCRHVSPPIGGQGPGERCTDEATEVGDLCKRHAKTADEQERTNRRHLRLASDNTTTTEGGTTVPIETATGGDVRNLEQVRAELDSIIREQEAEREDAQSYLQRVMEEAKWHTDLKHWVEGYNFPDDVIGAVRDLADHTNGRVNAAAARIAAADGTLSDARQALSEVDPHRQVKAAVDQAGGMAVTDAYAI
ncbi:hypothetical protein [Micromonospora aurantiaca (nom. illeg.)]|uniref:hypothetical protein n=1 Tax=Micromonospora aurantiaca (nom. illeg.) TaxID=47850 RepID=UPI0011A1E779|nr:hypothetical protein [Micromonospora aurantiaca]MBC9000533.1 hypothetical protein [Micromonospora aurantiaca]